MFACTKCWKKEKIVRPGFLGQVTERAALLTDSGKEINSLVGGET